MGDLGLGGPMSLAAKVSFDVKIRGREGRVRSCKFFWGGKSRVRRKMLRGGGPIANAKGAVRNRTNKRTEGEFCFKTESLVDWGPEDEPPGGRKEKGGKADSGGHRTDRITVKGPWEGKIHATIGGCCGTP